MINKEVKKIKTQIDSLTKHFFDSKIRMTKKDFPNLIPILNQLKKYCLGGKRLRVILSYYSYLACGGKEKNNFLKLAVSLELLHNYLLIHDDIVDRDELRRGQPTLHKYYARIRNDEHLGLSLAIIGGDFLNALAYENIFSANIKTKQKEKIINLINTTLQQVYYGELEDIILSSRSHAKEQEILLQYKYKTASYTVTLPVLFGAVMAGANQKQIKQLKKFSQKIGLAFQIKDDILDVFSQEKVIGKNIGTDIIEKKKTILMARTLENLDMKEKKYLQGMAGRKQMTAKEINQVKKLIKKSGALDYCNNLCQKYLLQSIRQIDKSNFDIEINKLIDVANYIVTRDK